MTEMFIDQPPLHKNTGVFIPEVKFGVSSGKIAVFRNVVAQS